MIKQRDTYISCRFQLHLNRCQVVFQFTIFFYSSIMLYAGCVTSTFSPLVWLVHMFVFTWCRGRWGGAVHLCFQVHLAVEYGNTTGDQSTYWGAVHFTYWLISLINFNTFTLGKNTLTVTVFSSDKSFILINSKLFKRLCYSHSSWTFHFKVFEVHFLDGHIKIFI